MNPSKMCEIDRLLPSPVSDRKVYYNNYDNQSRRRSHFIAGAAILALLFSVHSILPSGNVHRSNHPHKGKNKSFEPKEQLSALQRLTEKSLAGVLPAVTSNITPGLKSSYHSHPKGKLDVLVDEDHTHNHIGSEVYHCTSQVMIMRHCDKEVKVTHHGKEHTTDKRDKNGDRHCSSKGKHRSKYIATLFIEPGDYQELLAHDRKEFSDGIPPLPMIKSSLSKVSSEAASKKPQFPSPIKLYALSSKRLKNKPSKEHANFREIETITPLSKKFHLDVDERFGVEEEGDLASDFFESLSRSVTENINLMMGTSNSTDSSSSSAESEILQLCNHGMTVVNWKHSRIPILAQALGCGKNEGCPKRYKGRDFDTVWLLTFQYSLLLGGNNDLDVDSSVLALESLSKSAQRSFRHHKKKARPFGGGSWKITSELVKEGFDSH